jgi:hypothetical protein
MLEMNPSLAFERQNQESEADSTLGADFRRSPCQAERSWPFGGVGSWLEVPVKV